MLFMIKYHNAKKFWLDWILIIFLTRNLMSFGSVYFWVQCDLLACSWPLLWTSLLLFKRRFWENHIFILGVIFHTPWKFTRSVRSPSTAKLPALSFEPLIFGYSQTNWSLIRSHTWRFDDKVSTNMMHWLRMGF